MTRHTAQQTQLVQTRPAATVWQADPAHSVIGFSVRHMMISEVTGKFTDFSVTVEQRGDDFAGSAVQALVKAESLTTENADRDTHLRSADFFDVENHPEITFVSRVFTKLSDERYAIEGDLTIRGITRPVVLDAQFSGKAVSPWGQMIAAFKATTTIDRYEFGLKWNQALEAGGVLVGKHVDITLNLELIAQ
jgi:polyisoprenoid-binding protein YceI